MNKIAVLITCHNRKEKTISSLASLFKAQEYYGKDLELSVYLTDDGSTDGTSEEIGKRWPDVVILKGSGSLFWAGGMRNSWQKALEKNYDGYLLVNDDTILLQNLFENILFTDKYSIKEFGKSGIYIGSTIDPETKELTYGGAVFSNRFLLLYHKVKPDRIPKQCQLGNANIMYVSHNVVNKIGTLHKGYKHGIADYDYTLKACKNNIPVLLIPGICGYCRNDHVDKYEMVTNLTLNERIKFLYSPTGLAFSDNLQLMKNHFPFRLPFVFFSGWFKSLFPKVYIKINNLRIKYKN